MSLCREFYMGRMSQETVNFAHAVLLSYERLNERLKQRNDEARRAVLDGYPYGKTVCELKLGVLPEHARRSMNIPILYLRQGRDGVSGNNGPSGCDGVRMMPYLLGDGHSIGYFSSQESGRFARAMQRNYRELNARREAQYESELLRLSDPKEVSFAPRRYGKTDAQDAIMLAFLAAHLTRPW